MKLLWLILFMGHSIGPVGTVLSPPADVTAKLRGTAEFTCQVDLSSNIPAMKWTFNGVIIYSFHYEKEEYPMGQLKYSVIQDGRNFTLRVKNLDYSDAGTYTCQPPDQDAEAHLVVLGTPKLFTTTPGLVEGRSVEYVCTAKFGGPSKADISPGQYPKLQMFSEDGLLRGTTLEQEPDGATDWYNFTQIKNITLKARMYGTSLTCEIRTSKPEMQLNVTTIMEFLYPVRDVDYAPKRERNDYYIGAVITCSARGNPAPTFKWEDTRSFANVKYGPSLNVTAQMIELNAWKCTASNTINGHLYNESVTAVVNVLQENIGFSTPQPRSYYFWKIVLGFSILTICLGVAVAVPVLWSMKKNGGRSLRTEEESNHKTDEEETQFNAIATEQGPGNPSISEDSLKLGIIMSPKVVAVGTTIVYASMWTFTFILQFGHTGLLQNNTMEVIQAHQTILTPPDWAYKTISVVTCVCLGVVVVTIWIIVFSKTQYSQVPQDQNESIELSHDGQQSPNIQPSQGQVPQVRHMLQYVTWKIFGPVCVGMALDNIRLLLVAHGYLQGAPVAGLFAAICKVLSFGCLITEIPEENAHNTQISANRQPMNTHISIILCNPLYIYATCSCYLLFIDLNVMFVHRFQLPDSATGAGFIIFLVVVITAYTPFDIRQLEKYFQYRFTAYLVVIFSLASTLSIKKNGVDEVLTYGALAVAILALIIKSCFRLCQMINGPIQCK